MHKDIVVADIEIDDKGSIKKLVAIHNRDHFPYGTAPRKKDLDLTGIRRWWDNRRIPMSRNDLEKVYGIVLPKDSSTRLLLLTCHGLSLSDSYWIREKGSSVVYNQLNFFENDYSYDLGDALFGKAVHGSPIFSSPDATSEGNLAKRWKIVDGKRTLFKDGSKPFCYEVYNEVIASLVCSHLGIRHVDYYLIKEDGHLYCACEDFVSYSQDFVTGYMICEGREKDNSEFSYQFVVRSYEELGIGDARKRLNQMLLVDYLVGNEDRHLNNFGLIRDSNSLSFLSTAPIFDTGSCLGFEDTDEALAKSGPASWKPFASRSHPSQLDYMECLPIDEPTCLFSLGSAVSALLATFVDMPRSRKKAILSFISARIKEVTDRFGLIKAERDFALTKSQQAIFEYALNNGGRIDNANILCSVLGVSKITALRGIEVLVNQGKLKRIGSRKTGFWEIESN